MSGYVKQIEYKTSFDGDEVVAIMKPLEYGDLLKLDAYVAKKATDSEILGLYVELLPKYITEMRGLRDKAGTEITKEEVCGSVYFSDLALELGGALFAAARPANPAKPA